MTVRRTLARRLGLHTQAFRIALGVGLAASVLHVALDTMRFHDQRLAQAGEAAHAAALLAARSIDADIAERTEQLVLQAGLLRSSPRAQLGERLQVLAASAAAYSWIGVADTQGRVLAANDDLLVGANVAARDWFQQGKRGLWHGDVHEALMLASLMQVRPDGEPWRFVDVAMPLRGPHVDGVLGAHLSWPWLQARLAMLEPGLPPGSSLLIVGKEGKPIGAPVKGSALALGSLDQGRAGATGWRVEPWPGQPDGVTGYARHAGAGAFKGFDWVTLVRVPVERWGAKADQRLLREALVSLGLAILVACLVGASVRGRPVEGA